MFPHTHQLPRVRRIPTLWILGALILLLMFLTTNAHATAGTGGGLPYEEGLDKLRASVTGPVAFVLSLIGIVIGALTLVFGGDMNGFFRFMVFIVLVIAVAVGAQNVLANMTGRGAVLDAPMHQPVHQAAFVVA